MAKKRGKTVESQALPALAEQPDQQDEDPFKYTRIFLGRKSKFEQLWTPKLREEILRAGANGASMTEISVDVIGVVPTTMYSWLGAEGKEGFTTTIQVAFFLAKAWWMRKGREHIEDKEFNTRLYELQMRNRYGWQGLHALEQLPAGFHGGEEDDSAGVRDAVDVEKIIEEAKKYAIDAEYTVVKPTVPKPPPATRAAPVRKKKKKKKMPPLPPGMKRGKKKRRKK